MVSKKSIILAAFYAVVSINSVVAVDVSEEQEQSLSTETVAKQESLSESSPEAKLEFGDWVFDCFGYGGSLGGQEASSDIQKYVRDMLKKANMPDADSIRIRKISTQGIFNIFRSEKNACVVNQSFLPKYMYISEKFFKDLPEDQRKFLIGHEIMHLKYNHTLIKSAAFFLGYIALLKTFGSNDDGLKNVRCGLALAAATFMILQSIVSRCCELHADKRSAIEFDNIDGGVGLMNHFTDYKKECEQELPQWKFSKWQRSMSEKIGKFANFFLGSHPLLENRIKWLEGLRTA